MNDTIFFYFFGLFSSSIHVFPRLRSQSLFFFIAVFCKPFVPSGQMQRKRERNWREERIIAVRTIYLTYNGYHSLRVFEQRVKWRKYLLVIVIMCISVQFLFSSERHTGAPPYGWRCTDVHMCGCLDAKNILSLCVCVCVFVSGHIKPCSIVHSMISNMCSHCTVFPTKRR